LLLDQYAARLLSAQKSALRLASTDAFNEAAETVVRLEVEHGGRKVRWALRRQGERQKVLKPLGSELANLNDLVREVASSSAGESAYLEDAVLPVYYDQRRALVEAPRRKRRKPGHGAIDAFRESRGKAAIDFRSFVYWFEERESEELRQQRTVRDYQDPQLRAVRRAIKQATGFSGLSYRAVPPRGMLVYKGNRELRVEQLSTGERVFLAMAGDLARRLSMISADKEKSSRARAIVLIDEVELHLHPRWQRDILPWLLRAFPECQFVVSTHSPQVLGEVEASQVRVLEYRPRGNRLAEVRATRGRDSNFLLLDVLGASERSPRTKDDFEQFEKALREGDLNAARARLAELGDDVEGAAPELSIARARLERAARSNA
jgi:predicted ATP-binding protein involved in virulence